MPRLVVALALMASAACTGGGFDPSAGDCLTLGGAVAGTDLTEATIVDCDDPHELEVFHTFELPEGATAGDALVEAVIDGCYGEPFSSYVGVEEAESDLEVLPLPPTDAEVERGQREVTCTVRRPAGSTGSVQDSGGPV